MKMRSARSPSKNAERSITRSRNTGSPARGAIFMPSLMPAEHAILGWPFTSTAQSPQAPKRHPAGYANVGSRFS